MFLVQKVVTHLYVSLCIHARTHTPCIYTCPGTELSLLCVAALSFICVIFTMELLANTLSIEKAAAAQNALHTYTK